MVQSCVPRAVGMVPGKQGSTAISAPILPRERELSLEHAQRSSFVIMEQCCGSLAVEMIPGKHCDFSNYLAKSARAHSGTCAEVQFPDYGTGLWSPGSRNGSKKALRLSSPILPRERELSLEHAQWFRFLIMEQSCGPMAVEMVPKKHCGYHHLSSQESDSSVWSMRRGALSWL
jgi:hypothetical protein